MKKVIVPLLVVVLIFGALLITAKARAPKAAPPTTQQIWSEQGVPVSTASVTRGDMEQSVEITGDISTLGKVTLSAKLAGRVAAVNAREGDPIARGMTVIQLDQDDTLSGLQEAQGALQSAYARLSQATTNAKVTHIQTNAGIEQAKSALRSAEARLKVVKKPARSQERLVAENSVASAKANLDNAESNYKRHQQLVKEGAISQSMFEGVEATYKVAKAQYQSAEQQLSMIKEGGRNEDILQAQSQVESAREALVSAKANASQNLLRQEDIRSAKASVEQAKASLDMAKQRLSYTSIKSMISGELATRLTEPGQVVSPGQALADVVNLSAVYFKGQVSEKELINVKIGQTVRVQVDAVPERTFTGTVAQIYPSGSTLSRAFPVRIDISGTGGAIKPGMFAKGNIVTGVDKDVLLVPKDAVVDRHGTKLVFTVDKKIGKKGKTTDIAKQHLINVIRENKNYVEIDVNSGLMIGDIVITSGRQNLQDGIMISIKNGQVALSQGTREQ